MQIGDDEMKYIAFKGTYNEQIYDTDKNEIRWTNYPEIVVTTTSNFYPRLNRKTWRKMK